MIELKAYTDKVLELFNIKDIGELGNVLMNVIFNKGFEDILCKYSKIVEGSKKDWIKHLYQYYQADRTKNKQDYTPQCIAELCAALIDCADGVVYDCCAGSGALTLAQNKRNKKLSFVCVEIDENVIPFLLFNLCFNNINATVINGDVLSGKRKSVYEVASGEKYASVKRIGDDFSFPVCQVAVSNPPYNIKWEPPAEIEAVLDGRFSKCDIPPSCNANYAFILDCMNKVEHRAVLVLPNSILSTENTKEKNIRKYLIKSGYIESIITLPEKMFDITGIGVCILTLTKTPQTSVAFVDCRGRGEAEERLQNGQFGGKSHINRTYKKIITTISNETITDIIAAIKQKKNIAGFCITTDIETIAKQNFSLEPSRYIEFDSSKPYHRKYCDIVKDINNIKKMQNSCKLTINKTLAVRIMGKDNVETYEKLTSGDVNLKKNIKTVTGCEMVKDDFINFTKAANEIKIECKNKEYLPPVFEDFVRTWITNNKNLGLFENIYLAELRDSLLPDLMDGTIDVSNMEIAEAKVK